MLHVLATYRASANERYVCAVTVTISLISLNKIEEADRPTNELQISKESSIALQWTTQSDCQL